MAAIQDQVNNLKVSVISVTGPASYSAGGFLVDASASLSWMGFMAPTLTPVSVLPGFDFEIICNQDTSGAEAFGKGVLKINRATYDKGSSGAVSGQPASVAVQSALSANTASTHTHAIDHDHGTVTSGAMAQAGAGSTAGASPDELGHTHVFTIPALTQNTTSSGSHTHDRAFEYDHNHAVTTTTTNLTVTELTAGTNLSAITFKVICYGFGPS